MLNMLSERYASLAPKVYGGLAYQGVKLPQLHRLWPDSLAI